MATREMYTWAQADHKYVLKLLGVAQFQDQLAMVSPWVEHNRLSIYLKKYPETDRCVLVSSTTNGNHTC